MLAWSDCGLEAVFEGPIAAEIDQNESGHLLEELLATIDREDEEAASRPGRPGQAYPAPRRSGVAAGKQFVVFVLAGDEYAIPIGNVVEYGHPLAVTPVPNVPEWLLGVANVHGDILSMVDLRAFLGMERPDHGADGRMLVVRTSRDNISVGLIVDRVKGIRVIAEDVICLPTSPAEDRLAPYLRGVAEHQGRLVIFLNLDQLLLSSEMRQFEPV
jgi:purine-binding chemotaxis protein CheW